MRIKRFILFLIYAGVITSIACKQQKTSVDSMPKVKSYVQEVNDISALFHIDSTSNESGVYTIYATDSSAWYNPMRHLQHYELTVICMYDSVSEILAIDSLVFDVHLPNRKDGRVRNVFDRKTVEIITRDYIPSSRERIKGLSQLAKSSYYQHFKDKQSDLIDRINMFLSMQYGGKDWTGINTYRVINQTTKMSPNERLQYYQITSNLLADTVYIPEQALRTKVYELIKLK